MVNIMGFSQQGSDFRWWGGDRCSRGPVGVEVDGTRHGPSRCRRIRGLVRRHIRSGQRWWPWYTGTRSADLDGMCGRTRKMPDIH